MYSGQDLYNAQKEQRELLSKTVKAMKVTGRKLAEAEKNYRVALCKKILTERASGTPVTIISDVCRGDEEVAELKFKRDLAESDYKVCEQAIITIRQEVKILDTEMENERRGQ